MISLPNLACLVCEPYLLREALRFVLMINVNAHKYNLRYLHIKFPDKEFLSSVANICPDVSELVIEDQGRDCAEAIAKFKNLKVWRACARITLLRFLKCLCRPLQILKLENYTWRVRDDESLHRGIFSNLTKLVLKNPKQIQVDKGFLVKLGSYCLELKHLSFTLYQRDHFGNKAYLIRARKTPFFPKLESLTLDGDVSLGLIETFLLSVINLKSLGKSHLSRRFINMTFQPILAIFIHNLGFPSGRFDTLMLCMARERLLEGLTDLQCFQWRVSLETMLFIIDQCPKLRHIWGLDLLMLSPEAIATIQQHIKRNNRDIALHDVITFNGSAGDDNKGIPFLSERSKHRVEAAEQLSDEERHEIILREGTMEDLLKEYCLL